MKKQILILTFLVLAVVAGTSKSYAQCDDALHPIAGKAYNYSVTVNPTGGTFTWYVTKDTDLLSGTPLTSGDGEIIAGTGYNDTGTGTSTIQIIWTAQAIANAQSGDKYFLVVKYDTSCSNNLKPWVITPLNLFQITVENVDAAGATLSGGVCRADVAGATVNASNEVVYDYGQNEIYLKVTANNFTGTWTPTVDMTALEASLDGTYQSISSMEWSLTTTFTGTDNFDLSTGTATAAVPDKGGDNVTTGTDEFIYIRIIIDHDKFEGTADQTIALNLSAVDAAGNADVDKDGSCNDITPDPDNVSQTLNARPGITSPTPSPFMSPEP